MQTSDYHPLLAQQLQSLEQTSLPADPAIQSLLEKVNQSYQDYERDLALRTDQLISSTSRAYSFLDSINKGFIMCDTSGELVLANDSLRTILSIPKNELLTIDTLDALLPSLKIKDQITACLQSKQPTENDDVSFRQQVLHFYLAPLLNNPGTENEQLLGAVMLLEDVTQQKILDRAKDEFLSIASHELRTPLTAIRGNASLIKKYYGEAIAGTDVPGMINDIHASSIRLIGIVNDFLDAASMEQGKITMKPEHFIAQEVIDEVVHELAHMCEEKGITLSSNPTQDIPTVYADRQRTKQVIINLIGNAIKFTDQGTITIGTRTDGTFVYTTITDTGRGMSEENQKLLFKKFQQAGDSLLTRDTVKGTGLGLYISKLIVEHSGGKIGLEKSAPGAGSSFTFSLPVA